MVKCGKTPRDDDPFIREIYYTIYQVAKKLNVSTARLQRTLDSKNTYFPIVKIGWKSFIRKDLVDGVTDIEFIERFNPTEGMAIQDAQKSMMRHEISSSPHVYAITLSTKVAPFSNYDPIKSQVDLDKFVNRCNSKLFGNNWDMKAKGVSLMVITENTNVNVHYHGVITFSEEYRARRKVSSPQYMVQF